MLCLADLEGPDAVPRLYATLRRDTRRAARRFKRMRMYDGMPEMMRAVIAGRRGRVSHARRVFAESLARRQSTQTAYLDSWVMVRAAIECHHYGDPADEISARFDEVDAFYARIGAHGMQRWLTLMRDHYGV